MPPYHVFLSYARNDDMDGFVKVLRDQVRVELAGLGPPIQTDPTRTIEIWRDVRKIEPSDQFAELISDAIDNSDALLVVLSRNWLSRPYCRQELEMFEKRWRHEGEAGIRKRIIVVGKHHFSDAERKTLLPAALQGQEGHIFFRRDGEQEAGREEIFIDRGKPSEEFLPVVKRLAFDMWRRAREEPPLDRRVTFAPPNRNANGRTIFLAKPADDMRSAYATVFEELRGRGFTVVPAPDEEIPQDATAVAFTEAAVAKAELAVHLLGDKVGYAPEEAERIVKLQMMTSAARAAKEYLEDKPSFRRLIWAPELLMSSYGSLDSNAAPPSVKRDPLAVRDKFDVECAGDKVMGVALPGFIDFLADHLQKFAPVQVRAVLDGPINANARVYVYHRPEDTDYALMIAEALKANADDIAAVFPAFDGTDQELNLAHSEELKICDVVVLCWARATEGWAKATALEYRDWEKLGRDKPFQRRGVVAGPPPGSRKTVLVRMPPRQEIDLVVDVTEYESPPPEKLRPLISSPQP